MTSLQRAASSVLVVGGGPSGLAAALTLSLNGVSTRVVAKELKPRLGHRGCIIHPRTQEMHQLLGVWDSMKSKALPVMPIVAYGVDGKTEINRVDLYEIEEPTPQVPNVNSLNLSQERQETILREHLAKLGRQVEFGVELVSLQQDADKVTVTLKNNITGKLEEAEFNWLIGADGGSSTVRKQLGIEFVVSEEGMKKMQVDGFISGDIIVNGKDISKDAMHIFGSMTDSYASLLPTEHPGPKRFCFGFGDDSNTDDESPMDRESIIATMEKSSGRNDFDFGELISVGRWRPNVRMAERFREGRVFLSGDAAHCHPPAGGQGMNTGVQDAVNLGWKLSLVEQGHASPKLLDSYNAERLPVIASMLELTSMFTDRMYSFKGDLSSAYRRGRVAKMLGITYRNSPIVVAALGDESDLKVDSYRSGEDGMLKAGDRAPDATAGLFDIFSVKHHTVLLFGLGEDEANEVVRFVKEQVGGAPFKTVVIHREGNSAYVDVGADYVLEDKDGSAFEGYQVKEKAVVVVRPDGAIGVKSDGLDGLREYTKIVFA